METSVRGTCHRIWYLSASVKTEFKLRRELRLKPELFRRAAAQTSTSEKRMRKRSLFWALPFCFKTRRSWKESKIKARFNVYTRYTRKCPGTTTKTKLINLCRAYNFSDHVISHKATLRVKQLQEREREREREVHLHVSGSTLSGHQCR